MDPGASPIFWREITIFFDYKKHGKVLEDLNLVMQLGLTMAGCILFCFAIGYYLDKWLNTKGIFITVFLLLGIAGGGYTAYRQILESTGESRSEKDRNGERKQ
ncbi:MAG: AtpZ/AtpI family protein [Deltaproteobacteria bacterium]|nr:AtpZ/AtpI family protein [Deltaproteobacteria bacterium]